jgi:two-component system chemotaxis response regulator CheB
MPLACIAATGAPALPIAALARRLAADAGAVLAPPVPVVAAPSRYTCPDCHGVLFELDAGPGRRFRCPAGHAWSVTGLLAERGQALESALWMALRSLEDKAALTAQLAAGARGSGHELTATRLAGEAAESGAAAGLVRRLLVDSPDVAFTDDPAVLADEPGTSRGEAP